MGRLKRLKRGDEPKSAIFDVPFVAGIGKGSTIAQFAAPVAGAIFFSKDAWQKIKHKTMVKPNPWFEPVLAGIGGGLGFFSGTLITKAFLEGKKKRKRNPMAIGYHNWNTNPLGQRKVVRRYKPVTFVPMSTSEVMNALRFDGYDFAGNYEREETAAYHADQLERTGHEVKVVLGKAPFAKPGAVSRPYWLLSRLIRPWHKQQEQ